jgi:aryl-alcohol dehydrogenase-like predicted oxidoreductase
LKKAGKIRFVGVSVTEHDADSGMELVEDGLVDTLQVIYNIFDPTAADRLFPCATKHGVGIIARVPLDEGGLTGAIDGSTEFAAGDFRATYFRGERRKQLIDRIGAIQHDLAGKSPALPETAIRFCLSHPAVTTVIPGMRRRSHVEHNVRAAGRGPLPKPVLSVLKQHSWKRNFYN